MYSKQEVLEQIRRKAERAGMTVGELLAAADVDASQWTRWNKPDDDPDATNPTLPTLQRIFRVPDRRRRRRVRA